MRAGAAFMAGVQLRDDVSGDAVAEACTEAGVLIRTIHDNTLQICPPFVTTEDEVALIAQTIAAGPRRLPRLTDHTTAMTTDLDLTTFKALSFDCYGTPHRLGSRHRRGAGAVGPRTAPRPDRGRAASSTTPTTRLPSSGTLLQRSTPRCWPPPSAGPGTGSVAR